MKHALLTLILVASLAQSLLADFTQVSIPGLAGGMAECRAVWADFDNDGRLDFLSVGGGNATTLWRNNGSGFDNVTASMAPGLPTFSSGTAAWGDYDNDGRVDFILVGQIFSGGGSTQIWRNTGSGFVNVTATVAPGITGSPQPSVAWGDYDNDGRLDLLIAGVGNGGFEAQIWRNTLAGFINATASVAPGLLGGYHGAAAWGDYDNDGWLDFLLAGSKSTGPICQIWRNTGSGFTNVTATLAPGLPGFSYVTLDWGDYDGDGRLDFILSGYPSSASALHTQIWHNTGTGFVDVTASVAPGLSGGGEGDVTWGDYDSDGRLDFLFSGDNADGSSFNTQLWRNTGSTFTDVTASVASGLPSSVTSIAWGDYDGDGRLDLLLAGGYLTPVTQLWKNNTAAANTAPTAPAGLSVTAGVNGLTFAWNAATDTQTAASALNYQLRIGTTSGGSDLVAPMAAAGGQLRVPSASALQYTRSRTIKDLPLNKPLYWSVQAADNGSLGSPFAAEQVIAQNAVLTQLNGVVVPGDTNGDGVVSTAEFAVVRSLLPNELATQNAAGYYTTAQVQALNVGVPLIQRGAGTGTFQLQLQLQKSTNLTSFAPFPFTPGGTTITGDGKVQYQFTTPDNAAFFRLQSSP